MAKSISEEQFVTLLLRYGTRLKTFAATLLPLQQDVEEVVQDACLVAWRKIDSFEFDAETPDREFFSWVCTICRFEVLNLRRKKWGRETLFDDEMLDRCTNLQLKNVEYLEQRSAALKKCLNKLPSRDKELVQLRYHSEASVESVAQRLGRTVSAIYKSLTRIRKELSTCIERTLHREDLA